MDQPLRIQQLDDRTIGYIAAGEVVERPAQVVKELIENSIDANSTRISVEIERGGFDLISVSDDGTGIHSDDLALALDRHATSKLVNENDLAQISTLGFRGEALASIGMVSQMTISSRTKNSDGNSISMNDGHRGELAICGMAEGTRIEVASLFKNQPARLAFQRRPATEASKIVDIVVDHAMANAHIGFKLTNDARVVLDIPAVEDPNDRLFDLLGGQASSLIPLEKSDDDEQAPGDERWSGWISTPDISRGRGDDIHILINSRPVASQPFLKAIRRGYKTRLMQGRHPVAILNLQLPNDEVDVNVHPTKREVRFKHSWRVLERLERAISYTLARIPTQPESSGTIAPITGLAPTTVPQTQNTKQRPSWAINASSQLSLEGVKAEQNKDIKSTNRPISSSPITQQTLTGESPIAPALSSAERELHRHAGQDTKRPDHEDPLGAIINDLPVMEPLSQFANSYIMVQSDDELLIVDQHALHERIRYERLRHDESLWTSQPRITPISIDLNARQLAKMSAAQNVLSELGFVFVNDSEGWNITAAPNLLDSDSIGPFVHDLLLDLSEDGGVLESVEKVKDELAFMRSCRGAVKANEKLSLPEMRRLLEDMRRIPNPWACVHGRPTAMRIPINALDHHFGRHG